MDSLYDVIESLVTIALDDSGWTLLKPVMEDGSLGQSIDSTDVAEIITKYLVMVLQ